MVRVRFAPSPTGPLHLGNALTAVANRRFADEHGGTLLLRIDDTDPARNVPLGEHEIVADLEWLGLGWEEGPLRQSDRAEMHRAAVERLLEAGAAERDDAFIRFRGERRATLLRADGSPTYHLASAVDDIDQGITHVIRGQDHIANTPLHVAIAEALGADPPQFVHHGLLLGPDGAKLSKRDAGAGFDDLRQRGIPAEAVRRYLEELGLPRGNVFFDLGRLKRLATDVLAELSDEELAERLDVEPAYAVLARGARDLVEARRLVTAVVRAPGTGIAPDEARPTLERFRELRDRAGATVDAGEAKTLIRELKAVGGDLRALRVALTGAEQGPELWRIVAALPRDEALRRLDAAVAAA